MNKFFKIGLAALLCACVLGFMTGCENTTVMKCIISAEAYESMDAIKHAAQPDSLTAGAAVYASAHMIESPKGMTYTARWSLDGVEIYSQELAMQNDRQGVLLFELPSELVAAGKLKLELLYKDRPAFDKELPVK